MDRKAFEDAVVAAVRPLLEEFRRAPGAAQAKYDEDVARLESEIEGAEDGIVRDALTAGLAKLKKAGPAREDRSAEEEKAWNAAGRRLRISTRVGRARRAAGSRMRRSAKAVEEAADRVKDALEDAVYYTKSEIAEKTDMAEDLLKSAIARLKREGEIESNGERGVRGAYRRKPAD